MYRARKVPPAAWQAVGVGWPPPSKLQAPAYASPECLGKEQPQLQPTPLPLPLCRLHSPSSFPLPVGSATYDRCRLGDMARAPAVLHFCQRCSPAGQVRRATYTLHVSAAHSQRGRIRPHTWDNAGLSIGDGHPDPDTHQSSVVIVHLRNSILSTSTAPSMPTGLAGSWLLCRTSAVSWLVMALSFATS